MSVSSKEAGSQTSTKGTGFKPDLNRIKFGVYRGLLMPYCEEPLEVHVPKVMNLSLRDTDIVLLTYPKSGSHWTWRILDMLASGDTVYNDSDLEAFGLAFIPSEVLDKVSKDVRRVIHTHFCSDMLPAQLREGRVKVVHVYRNPKAVLVSLTFHLRNGGKFPDISLEKLESMMNTGKAPHNSQFYYWDKIQEYERNNPNVDIFHLAYEDLKQDTVGCIKQLAAYLNVEASEELCTSIAKAVSFGAQKKKEEGSSDFQKVMQIYRKGEVDDWKNHMTVAQSERMDKAVADRAASCQFSRRYCPTITTDQGHHFPSPVNEIVYNAMTNVTRDTY